MSSFRHCASLVLLSCALSRTTGWANPLPWVQARWKAASQTVRYAPAGLAQTGGMLLCFGPHGVAYMHAGSNAAQNEACRMRLKQALLGQFWSPFSCCLRGPPQWAGHSASCFLFNVSQRTLEIFHVVFYLLGEGSFFSQILLTFP